MDIDSRNECRDDQEFRKFWVERLEGGLHLKKGAERVNFILMDFSAKREIIRRKRPSGIWNPGMQTS